MSEETQSEVGNSAGGEESCAAKFAHERPKPKLSASVQLFITAALTVRIVKSPTRKEGIYFFIA